jgi:hypothetical protein
LAHGCYTISAVAKISALLLLGMPVFCWGQQSSSSDQRSLWQRFEVTVVARGSSTASSTGDMDLYLAMISSKGRHHSIMAAQLVDYYSHYEQGISDDRLSSRRPLRLYLAYAGYCRIDAKAFLVRHIFDAEALATIRGPNVQSAGLDPGQDASQNSNQDTLPCFIVHR